NDEILQCKIDVEVTPVGIVLLDQSDLPIAPPLLDLFLACDGRYRVIIALEPDEPIDTVSGAESSQQLVFMLVHPTDQIIGHAQIQRPVSPARKQIDVVAQHCFSVVLVSLRRLSDRASSSFRGALRIGDAQGDYRIAPSSSFRGAA